MTGSTNPEISRMTEIPAGASIQLRSGELTFLHYVLCKFVTVSGGTLTLTETDFTTNGNVIRQADALCPRIPYILPGGPGAVSGGMLMRSLTSIPQWPLSREIILGGPDADRVRTAIIYSQSHPGLPIIELEIYRHLLRFPSNVPGLTLDGYYMLRLTESGRAQPIDIPFVATPPLGPALLIVLREP